MLFQMRFRTLFTLLLSLIALAGSASADMRFNFENCYRLTLHGNLFVQVYYSRRFELFKETSEYFCTGNFLGMKEMKIDSLTKL
mgnify:FL=1